MISNDKETPVKEKHSSEVFSTPKATTSVWSFINTATPTTSVESRDDASFKTPVSNSGIRKRKKRVSDYGLKVNQQPVTLLTPLKIYDHDKEIEDLVDCVKAGSELSPDLTSKVDEASVSNRSKRRRLSLPMQSFKFSNFDPVTLFDETPKNSVKKTKKRKSLRLPRKSISRVKTPEAAGSSKTSTVKTSTSLALKQKTYANSKISLSSRKTKFCSKIPEISLLPNKDLKLCESTFSTPIMNEGTNRIVESSLTSNLDLLEERDISTTVPCVHAPSGSDIQSSESESEANEHIHSSEADMLPTALLGGTLPVSHSKSLTLSPEFTSISDTSSSTAEANKSAQNTATENNSSSAVEVFQMSDSKFLTSPSGMDSNMLSLTTNSNKCIENNVTLEEPSGASLANCTQTSSTETGRCFLATSNNLTQPVEKGRTEEISTVVLEDVCQTPSNGLEETVAESSKSQPFPRRSSRAKIRKSVPKLDIRQTPMGLPRPTREKKEKFSVEEVYLNKNFRTPTEKKWETIFEFPKENKDGSLSNCEKRKKRRRLEFVVDPSQRKPKWKKKNFKSNRRKSKFPDFNIDEALAEKLYKLDVALKLADLSP